MSYWALFVYLCLLVLGLPSCDTIWHNAKVVFNSCVSAVDNRIVRVIF